MVNQIEKGRANAVFGRMRAKYVFIKPAEERI
jgi:hypothetical protein